MHSGDFRIKSDGMFDPVTVLSIPGIIFVNIIGIAECF
jgi:hypothetical protein